MGMNQNIECYIISDNKEFETLKKFWAEKEIEINISSDISGNVKKSQEVSSTSNLVGIVNIIKNR